VTHALLDLAEGRLLVDDPDGAAVCLAQVQPSLEQASMVRTRLQIRWRYLRARLEIGRDQLNEGRALAEQAQRDADMAGIARYRDLAFLTAARAASLLGEPVDLAAIQQAMERLPSHAGLEAWPIAADIAAATRIEPFWGLAEQHAEHVALNAGERADAFRRYATARLDKIRTRGRHGL
jgi:hypothetical protein